jgi:hypothetical protein
MAKASIGEYKLKKDTQIMLGISAFTSPQGSTVNVRQIDNKHSKALVEFGPRLVDWFSFSFVEKNMELSNG